MTAESIWQEVVPPNGFQGRVNLKPTGGYLIDLCENERWQMVLVWIVIISLFVTTLITILATRDFSPSALIFVLGVAKCLLRPSTRLDIDDTKLVWEGDWVLFKNRAVFQKDEIIDVIVTDIRARRSNPPRVIGNNIRIQLPAGQKIVLVRSIENKSHALWFANLIRLGLGLETHSESHA